MITNDKELSFGYTSPFIYCIFQNALIMTNMQLSAFAVLIIIRDTIITSNARRSLIPESNLSLR